MTSSEASNKYMTWFRNAATKVAREGDPCLARFRPGEVTFFQNKKVIARYLMGPDGGSILEESFEAFDPDAGCVVKWAPAPLPQGG